MTVHLIFSRPTFVSCYLPEICVSHSAARKQQLRQHPLHCRLVSYGLTLKQWRRDTPEMVQAPSPVRLLVFCLLLPGSLGRECTSEGLTKYFISSVFTENISYFFNIVTKYFADSLIFAETCTADCPQFLEDRQKLGEPRSVKRELMSSCG